MVLANYRGAPSTPGLGDRSPVKNGKGDEVMRVGTQKGKTRERERERERIKSREARER